MKKKGKIYHKSHAVQKVLFGSPTLPFLFPVQTSLRSPSISHDYCNSAVFPTQHSTISPCFTVPIPSLTHLFCLSVPAFSLTTNPALVSPLCSMIQLSYSLLHLDSCLSSVALCIFHLPSTAPC